MKTIQIIKDTKINYKTLSKKDFTFYSLREFFEDSYYLSFHKEIMKICIYDIKTIEDYNKIFDLLKGFTHKFDRKGLYEEKQFFSEIIFFVPNVKLLRTIQDKKI